MITIRIATDFSRHPAGRFRKDGKFSGERFRDEFLVGPLKEGKELTVILDGARSYGSSFLEEAFGGLVRNYGFNKEELLQKLHIVAETDLYKTYQRRATDYIKDARP